MYDNDFENKKLIINYNAKWILLSDWHEWNKIIDAQEQLFEILHTWKHNFSEEEIKAMKNHMWIDKQTCIKKIIEHELTDFRTSRSWGKWWQNVNKVETKVQLFFNIQDSKYLDQEQKNKIIAHAHRKDLHHDNSIIWFVCQEERTQWKNKDKVIKEFTQFMNEALEEEKQRIETEIPEYALEKGKNDGKKHTEKKKERRENKNPKIELD